MSNTSVIDNFSFLPKNANFEGRHDITYLEVGNFIYTEGEKTDMFVGVEWRTPSTSDSKPVIFDKFD